MPSKIKYLLGPVATVFNSDKTGSWRIVRPVVDAEKCVLCGLCRMHCPTDVIDVPKKNEGGEVAFNFDNCKGCGICFHVCPKEAITMISEREAQK